MGPWFIKSDPKDQRTFLENSLSKSVSKGKCKIIRVNGTSTLGLSKIKHILKLWYLWRSVAVSLLVKSVCSNFE